MTVALGMKLGPYEILGPLGAGGMGEVHRARDTRLGREVALKVLPESFARDPERLERFEREARAVAALSHPNVLALYDYGTVEGTAYTVTELLEGETLRARLAAGALPAKRAVEIAIQVAHGLAAAHDKGIVHRDLKPENVWLCRDGRVKVLDFGLAKQQGSGVETSSSLSPTAAMGTAAGLVVGTAGYMAPEQVRGLAVDGRADVFAFGAVLYEMVSGRRAFRGETAADTMSALLREDPPELSRAVAELPAGLERIVARCLEKEPAARFQSAHDLAFALEAVLSPSSSGTRAPAEPQATAPTRRRAVALLGLAALALLAAGVFAARAVLHPKQPVFHDITSERGFLSNARFTPDGAGVVYGAAWVGRPMEIFSARTDDIGSRPLGLPSGDVLSIARNGDMLLLTGRTNRHNWTPQGTLALANLSGGTQRDLVENARDGALSPDGSRIAVVRRVNGMDRLECPLGHVLHATTGWVSTPRFSPRGDRIAFLDHPLIGDDAGHVVVVDLAGHALRASRDYTGLQGLAWSRSGRELWFTGTPPESPFFELYAVRPGHRERVVLSAPGDLRVEDVNARGEMLLSATHSGTEVGARFRGDSTDRVLNLFSEGHAGGLSADGRVLAIIYTGPASGADYSSWILREDSDAPVRIGDGAARSISPDGRWVVATFITAPHRLDLLPVGTGESRRFDLGAVHVEANSGVPITWTSDGSAFLFLGADERGVTRAWLLDVRSGRSRPVTPAGTRDAILAPDASAALARGSDDALALYPLGGGRPRALAGTTPGDLPLQWAGDGRSVFLWNGSFPARVDRYDLASGRRLPWRRIAPPDPTGVIYGNLLITPDGESYAYRYRRVLSRLLVTGDLR